MGRAFIGGSVIKSTLGKTLVIAACLAIGYGSYRITQRADSVVEQVAEAGLSYYGIDMDFSEE